jgi:hypothetical protein
MARSRSRVALSLVILTAPLAVDAQQPGKTYRIAWLGLAAPSPGVRTAYVTQMLLDTLIKHKE